MSDFRELGDMYGFIDSNRESSQHGQYRKWDEKRLQPRTDQNHLTSNL